MPTQPTVSRAGRAQGSPGEHRGHDRVVAIDPATGALVWQYGITGKLGTEPGELNTPGGFDLLLPDGSAPTRPVTG